MEVFDDTDSINKIMIKLKKDQKKIEAEIKQLNDEPVDISTGFIDFRYIIDCHGEHRFDVHVKFRKTLLGSLGNRGGTVVFKG